MRAVCSFKLAKGTTRQFIEESIATAIFNAECVFGKPRVRVSGLAYYVAADHPACIIDVSTEVGEHVAQVFTGIMINRLGEEKFKVRRIDKETNPAGMVKERTTAR
jgi:hypothetical protein